MKRYYIGQVIGTGAFNDPYRSSVQIPGIIEVSLIPTGPDGKPLSPWCLSMAAAKDHTGLLADPRNLAMPDLPLDVKVSAIQTATKNAMIAGLAAKTIDTSFIGASDGYRDVIRGIGQQLSPLFNENNFDVSDV